MIELSHVTKSYNVGRNNQFTAVDDVSLSIESGQLTVFKGPSGSGKTTLLSLVGCMSRPSSGRIRLHGIRPAFLAAEEGNDGFDISNLPERFLTEIRRTTFGFIFQQFNLVRGISVRENVMLPAYPTTESHAAFQARAEELLRLFDISRHAASRVEWLSGGELQRVAIARALINNPAVIIADEPTAHLDSKLSREFMEIVALFKGQGKTVLIASHDPIVYDSRLADRVVEMRDGRITVSGPEP
ncbi:ABC transporter ATP-binding protein [Oryzomonas japonica]|uniref:ABC transporter ATP-binding protein n=1 Tax=Oryzomonas japonica TaxID=2603858 RepID=A0A7J4ZTX3_9BACT|nr:ABC transporter ATP-binding protein [Oryzomonas japonica]KAB0666774.1 ABC transporter ATP-binding protein [Oryzomonas japonica]